MRNYQVKDTPCRPLMQFIFCVVTLSLAELVLSSGAVMAHHGVTGYYDTSKPILLAGTVTRATFSPPHPLLSVRAAEAELPDSKVPLSKEWTGPVTMRPEDAGQVREVEFSPVKMFYDLASQVREGDRVVVIALRNCRPPHQLRCHWIQLSNGEVFNYDGGLHRKVDGCK